MDPRIDSIERHIVILNEEMGTVQTDLATVKTDVKWLVKTSWFQMGLLGSLLLAAVASLLFS